MRAERSSASFNALPSRAECSSVRLPDPGRWVDRRPSICHVPYGEAADVKRQAAIRVAWVATQRLKPPSNSRVGGGGRARGRDAFRIQAIATALGNQ
jgi:hypothetical protein